MEKLCFFNTAKAWGGGEKWHFEVSSYLHQKGHSVLVIAHSESVLYDKLLKAGIPCQGIGLTNLSFLNPLKHASIKNLLKKNNVRTIIMNLSRDVKIAGPSAKKAEVKRIIYRRGSAIPIKNSFLNRFLFKKVISEVLANSIATKKTVLENNPNLIPEEKIKVIYNGINIVDTNTKIKQASEKEFVLANLGRLEYQKNQKFLIPLAIELKKRGLIFKVIIGGEGRLRNELEAMIKEHGLEEHVLLSGFVHDPISFLFQADVFVLPSLWEGFGYVLAEAALCKKPIIAFDISSNPELVVHGKTGYLLNVNDIEAFADKVVDLYENKDLRTQMGLNGFIKVKENFDRKKQLRKIEDYLVNG
ncbi:glycosyltransferase [Flagellimonas meridianipacifica]|uniref:Glycosyltransferase involved in cell wall biosynthesis n=1 Tax=Flagellimonas meridianipacifica TaxID=1080225 RepID=A0A2T0M992_9FLAO|nr:glycosyltransferase [Allomuricauda pacifica]PRX54107.1 glycosyltransferase involved in cell wall biosynthesis [Allomuricauda pacifica]